MKEFIANWDRYGELSCAVNSLIDYKVDDAVIFLIETDDGLVVQYINSEWKGEADRIAMHPFEYREIAWAMGGTPSGVNSMFH